MNRGDARRYDRCTASLIRAEERAIDPQSVRWRDLRCGRERRRSL